MLLICKRKYQIANEYVSYTACSCPSVVIAWCAHVCQCFLVSLILYTRNLSEQLILLLYFILCNFSHLFTSFYLLHYIVYTFEWASPPKESVIVISTQSHHRHHQRAHYLSHHCPLKNHPNHHHHPPYPSLLRLLHLHSLESFLPQ